MLLLCRHSLTSGTLSRLPLAGAIGGPLHATERFIKVTATVADKSFSLHAQEYRETGNYQVQNCRENKIFFERMQALGADVSYITLQNDTWTQVRGNRSINLEDASKAYCTSFTLSAEPALPPKAKK